MTYQNYIKSRLEEIKEQNKIERKKKIAKQWSSMCGYMSELYSLKTRAKYYGLRVVK